MRSKASAAGASSTSERPSRPRLGRAVPMPYRRAGERPRAAAGSRLRLQRHHLRRRAPARRALRRDLRRDRDRGLARALLRRVRGLLRPRDRRARPATATTATTRPLPSGCSRAGRRSTSNGLRAGETVHAAAAACVREIAARVPVAVASGAARAEVEAVLVGSGLRGLFDVIVAAEDVERGKPDPLAYATALGRLGDPGRRDAGVRGHPPRRRGGRRGGDAVPRRGRHRRRRAAHGGGRRGGRCLP